MNYELFLAKRLIADKQHKNSVSSPIIKIAIIAIALGLIIMMIAIATSIGLQHKIREKISGFNGHVQITNFDNNFSEITLKPVTKNQDFYPKFETVNGVKNVQVYATKAGIIRTENDFEGIVLKGVSTDYQWQFFKEYLIKGRIPNFTGKKKSNEVLLSQLIADRMHFSLGQEFNVLFMKDDPAKAPIPRVFKIVGIYNSGFQDFDESVVIGDIRHIQKLNKWKANQVGGFEVFIEDFSKIKEKGAAIYQALPSVPDQLESNTIVEKYRGLFEWIALFDTNTYLIIFIMILVAGINMITALLVIILEKTQMIGILKALGSTNWSIRKLFLYNASYLILRGLFWGNFIGISLLYLQHYFKILKLDPATYYVDVVPVYIHFGYIILLNIGTLILCYAMLIVPSIVISKVSPVKAIKFD